MEGQGSTSTLSLFATGSVSNYAGSVISSSAPHTPPSTSPTSSFDQQAYSTSPYIYHSTSKPPLRLVKREEEEDEIVLGYTTNYPFTNRLGYSAQPEAAFSAQRSAILKINALTGTGTGLHPALPALLHPSHHPRSLWTLATHTEGYEPFVWAIFDSHEHALSALGAIHPPTAEPAIESDLRPFSKLRKVDMKVWSARVAETSFDSPGAYSPMQRYSPTDAYSPTTYSPTHRYSPTKGYSPTNTYSPQNSYPPALYHQSNYHHHTPHTESKYAQEKETTTPIPHPFQPQPQPPLEHEHDDHSTPIPPSHTPAYPSEMNRTRKHHIDADGGVQIGAETSSTSYRTPPPPASPSPPTTAPSPSSAGGGFLQADQDGDGEAQVALNGTRTRGQNHLGGSESEDGTTAFFHCSLENDTNVRVVPWNGEGLKGNEPSLLDRDLDGPAEEADSKSSPDSRTGPDPAAPSPSPTSFSFAASFVQDHHPLPPSHSSHFTSHVARPALIGDVEGVDVVGAKTKKKMPPSGTERGDECIEKTWWTATAGSNPKERLAPAEPPFSPLPSRTEYGCPLPLPPLPLPLAPDHSPLADARRASEVDRVKTDFTPALTASQAGSNTNRAPGYGSGSGSGSLRRFSPMLGRPFQSRGVDEDEGTGDVARDENGFEVLRGRAGPNCVDDACALRSSTPPSQTLQQQFRQRDLQKQPFLHEYPPHSPSFFPQNQQQQQQQQLAQAQQQQQQYTYPASTTTTYTHTSPGVAPPTAFRHGDWLCNMPGCGVHNFGRNISCIMCGAERAVSAAAGVGLGFRYAAASSPPGMQSSGGMTLSMGMGMTMGGDNELDGDYAYALDGLRSQGGAMGTSANAVGLNRGRVPNGNARSNTFLSQSYSLGQPSTYIPVIPRFSGQHYNVGAPQTGNGDIAMNSTLVQALGGISQVAAIQDAIKAHQSQMQLQDGRGRFSGANNVGFAAQRHANNGGRDGTFSMSAQGGQLLIPTTLGNSPPTSLQQGPIVVQQGRGSRFGEARGDGQGRNPNLMVPGMQHHGLSSFPSQYSQQGHSMQQNHHLQHPLSPHPSISASLLNGFSPASAALAAAAIPASKIPALLTPSGRKFATGGRVQNISRDELNPLLMFWPDNEPLPLTSQIRPPAAVLMALGGVQGPPPPILNTGNKGPIDAQPGDWTCGKCDYLNWRRRRVCANCFPHAEGNTEGTKHSTNDVQERFALLASVLFQQQQQVQAQQRQIQSQQVTAAAFASAPNESISQPGNASKSASFASSNVGSGMPSQQQQLHAEAQRRNDTMPVSKMDSMSTLLLEQKYGYAVPPPSELRPANSTSSFDQPLPLNLPPRMTHPSASESMISRGFMDFNRNAPSFQPIRADSAPQFEGLPQRLRSSPPSSRSSFSIGSSGSFYKSANEPTPSPLPLLPAFLQEVVGETSESSSSSIHESPSPPSPSSTSSVFGNTYSGDPSLSELVGAGLRRREQSSPASVAPQISNNIHRTASHSSIWTFGYPGDRKEGIRPV